MADNINNNPGNSGGNTAMAFIIGAVVVVLAIVAWVVFSGGMNQTKKVDVDVDLPKVEAPSIPTPTAPGN